MVLSFSILVASSSLVASPVCEAQAPSTAQLQSLSGEYTDLADLDTPYDVYFESGKLLIESERMIPTVLVPRTTTEFIVVGSKTTFNFAFDGNGRAAELTDSSNPAA